MPVVRGLVRFAFAIGLVSCLSPLLPLIGSGAARSEPGAKAKVAFVGDSLVQQYYAGVRRLTATNACLKSHLDLGNFSKPATGLANAAYFNWQQEVVRVTESYRPTLTVISIGMNDRLGITGLGARVVMRGTPAWTEQYRERIMTFIQSAAAHNAIVLFVGMPIMRQNIFNADMMEENRLYAEVVAKLGSRNVRYIEPWKLNASGPDVYAAVAPVNGRNAQIRSSDGMHFAAAGEELLAAYVLPKIIAALAETGLKVDHCEQTTQAK